LISRRGEDKGGEEREGEEGKGRGGKGKEDARACPLHIISGYATGRCHHSIARI